MSIIGFQKDGSQPFCSQLETAVGSLPLLNYGVLLDDFLAVDDENAVSVDAVELSAG